MYLLNIFHEDGSKSYDVFSTIAHAQKRLGMLAETGEGIGGFISTISTETPATYLQRLYILGQEAFGYIQTRIHEDGGDWQLCPPDGHGIPLPGDKYGQKIMKVIDCYDDSFTAELNTGQRMSVDPTNSEYEQLLSIIVADRMEDICPRTEPLKPF